MKISLFLPTLDGGGAERVMVSLANGVAERGVSVDLVLCKAVGPYLKEVSSKVRVVDLKASRILVSLPKLICYLIKERPKVVYSTLTDANIICLWAKILSGSKSLFFVREASTLDVSSRDSKSFRTRIMPFLVRLFYRFSDGIVIPSKGAKKDFDSYLPQYRKKTHVIYNPVITDHFFELAKEPITEGNIWDSEATIVLAVGRLTKAKDYPTLLRAFDLFRESRNARLLILGEGEDRSMLEELSVSLGIDSDVYMPGFVENPFKFMKRASLYVLSSQWEGLPNALIQAACLGTPVVATSCPNGPSEILENGRWGNLVPIGSPEALAQAMLSIMDNPKPSFDEKSSSRFKTDEIIEKYCVLFGFKR